MTVRRPRFTPQEFAHARMAWRLGQDGQPMPLECRGPATQAAWFAFARGYGHDDVVGPRPLLVHPDAGREGHRGVVGANRTWSPTEFAARIEEASRHVRPKGTGPMFSAGHSKFGDEVEGVERPSRQRGDARCRSIGFFVGDADDVGEWTALFAAIQAQGGAYVRNRSGGHCPATRSCKAHPRGQLKWHVMVPLREVYTPGSDLRAARAEWKGELYAAARFTFQLVGGLEGRGFDWQLNQFLGRVHVGAPYDAQHADVPREVAGVEGLGFDVRACWAGIRELGLAEPTRVKASRVAAALPRGGPWDGADGEPPMVVAFKRAGLYVRPTAGGKHAVVCPWASQHTCGRPGDSSTILFPNGIFHCSHTGHSEGRGGGGGMREVLAALPPEAQAAHALALARTGPQQRSLDARTHGDPLEQQ